MVPVNSKQSHTISKKKIFILGSLILVLGLTLLLLPKKTKTTSKAAGLNASLKFTPSAINVATTNDEFEAHLYLDTDSIPVVGVDIVLTFDDTLLTPISITANPNNTSGFTLKTTAPVNAATGAFDFTKATIDTNGNGQPDRIEVSFVAFDWATNTTTSPFTGVIEVAKFRFRPKKAGTGTISLQFTPGNTIDSNIVSTTNPPTDVLAQIANVNVVIAGSPTITPTTVVPTPTPTSSRPWLPGDANDDHKVDGIDYTIWLLHYKQNTTRGHIDGDFNTPPDGIVDGIDYVIWLGHYGQSN